MMASLTTVTVRPEEELVLPHTYTPRGASEAAPGTQTQLADGVGYGAGDGSAEQRSQPRRLR